MKKKALWKDIWKEIWNNQARFLALFAIVLLGVGFFGGIKATGPDMLDTADQYYADHQLFDLKVLSTYGIEKEDVHALKDVDDVQVTPMRTMDIGMMEEEFLLKLFPYGTDEESRHPYAVVSGRLPQKSGEIALDANQTFTSKFSLGDKFQFNHNQEEEASDSEHTEDSEEWGVDEEAALSLEEQEYTVVGFVHSPIYIDRISRGSSQIGKGSLDGFGVVWEDDIKGDLYTEMYVRFASKKGLTAYTDEYNREVERKKEEIEVSLNGRPLERINEIRAEGKKQIFEAQKELQEAKDKLDQAQKELADARKGLDEGKAEYNQQKADFEKKIAAAEKEVADQQAQIDNGWADYQNGLTEWEANARQYADAKANWEIQKASLLKQMDSAVSLEELVKNPIPGEEGEKLAQQIQSLFDGEAEIERARAQLEAQQKTLAAEEVQLEEAQQTLNQDVRLAEEWRQQIEAERPVLQEKEAVLISRQTQLETIRTFLSQPYEELTDAQKNDMRAALAEQGEQTPLYQPFLQYLDGNTSAEEMKRLAEEEEGTQAVLQQDVASLQQSLDAKEGQLQELRIDERQAELLEKGRVIEYAKSKMSENTAVIDQQAQKLEQAKNVLLSEVQSSMQNVKGKIAAADQQFQEQGAALEAGRTELEGAKNQLETGQYELDKGKEELAKQKADGQAALADAGKKIEEGEAEYQKGLNEFEEKRPEAEKEIADGQVELDKAMKELGNLDEPVYFVQDRAVNPGYQEYRDNADRMSAIASIFPVFFFLIAALVSFTTMTRMVDEQRQQMGTLKGLGYNNFDIAKKFLVYSSIAGLLGTTVGLIFGYHLFPNVIFNAYGSLYNLPDVRIHYYLSYTLIAFAVALLCTVGPAVLATQRTLRENPAAMMRPKAPKSGKRVLLERIPAIWNKLGFNAKITIRNLVRYKVRNSMTIFGVAGCTALILTGFALKNSISGLAQTQFGEVMRYDAVVSLHPNNIANQLQEYDEAIAEYPEIKEHLHILQTTYKVEKEGVNLQDVNLFVPETTEHFSDFVRLQERGKTDPHSLTDEGAVLSEKLAILMDVQPGDELMIRDEEEMTYSIPIKAITENYTGHYLYLTPDLYEEVFAEAYSPNTDLLRYDEDKNWEDRFASEIMDHPEVALVTFMDSIDRAFADTLGSLDIVTLILIISAAALAFVVLYNLTNINVSERIRELSTIKVLGFYNLEVSMYVYRETFILSLIGVFFGFLLGSVLSSVVLKMVEVDFMLFPITILPLSYLYSALLSMAFSIIVMVIMHYRLKNVDMIEALKSVE